MRFSGDEWLALVRKLEQATGAGKLEWSGSDASGNPFDDNPGYSATIPRSATYNLRSRDRDGEFPYILRIIDPAGVEITEFKTISYGDIWEQNENSEQAASAILTDLYEIVTRLVTGAPQKAKSLLDGLDGLLTNINDDPF